MANFYSDQANVTQIAGSSYRDGFQEVDSLIRTSLFSYTCAGTEVTGDVIQLTALLPIGSVLRSGSLNIAATLGTGSQLSIGSRTWTNGYNSTPVDSVAAYLAATATTSAGVTPFVATVALGKGAVLGSSPNTGVAIVAGVTASTVLTAGTVIAGWVDYMTN